MSHLFPPQQPQGGSSGGAYSSSNPYGGAPDSLAFFSSGSSSPSGYYAPSGSSPGFVSGSMNGGGVGGRVGGGGVASGRMVGEGRWWEAFGTGGFEGEDPLLEELGINPSHILSKTLTVLNPIKKPEETIMDDADLAGPAIFCLLFGFVLLLSGKPQFSYIYTVALLGTFLIHQLLNLMSPNGLDAYRTASVLGYCLLPMVGLGSIGMGVGMDRPLGYLLSSISILWCTYSASGIFVAVLRMSDQRFLVAYPVGLFYGCFALFSVFEVGTGTRR